MEDFEPAIKSIAGKIYVDYALWLPHLSVEDLVQDGFLALHKVMAKNKDDKTFVGYALRRIRFGIIDAVREQMPVKKDRARRGVQPPVMGVINEIEHEHIPGTRFNFLEIDVRDCIHSFPKKEKKLFISHFINGVPLKKLGREFGVSTSRMSQILKPYKNRVLACNVDSQ